MNILWLLRTRDVLDASSKEFSIDSSIRESPPLNLAIHL